MFSILGLGIERIVLSVGIFMLAYGMHLSNNITRLLKRGKIKEAWDTPAILMGYLIAGYTAVLYNDIVPVMDESLLTSLVFFFGALIVWSTAYFNNRVFEGLVEE